MSSILPRRQLLQSLATLPFAASAPGWARAAAADAGLISSQVCVAYPETTEGPYYFDPLLDRSDITEGRPGAPMDMAIQVIDTECRPIVGARVDVWHCDAAGTYSGYQREGTSSETFLRGTQVTDAAGVVHFATIFPGWYRGRTVHVHLMVYLGDREVLTSQMFFPDTFVAQVFATQAPYTARGQQDTPLARDGIARGAGDGAIAQVARVGARIQSSLVVGLAA